MRTITYEEMSSAWDELCDWGPAQSDATAKQFMLEQPALGVYMLAQSENLSEVGGASDSPIFELVLASWYVLSKAAGKPLAAVPPEKIDAAEAKNLQMFEQLEEGSEVDFSEAVKGSVTRYNQHGLLGFAVQVLMSGHEENPELAPDSVGLELLTIKTAIDCLDQ